MFDFILLASDQDFLLALKPYCLKCLRRKKDVLKVITSVTDKEAQQIANMGIQCVSVKCVCHS